jgi:hypothetical protein
MVQAMTKKMLLVVSVISMVLLVLFVSCGKKKQTAAEKLASDLSSVTQTYSDAVKTATDTLESVKNDYADELEDLSGLVDTAAALSSALGTANTSSSSPASSSSSGSRKDIDDFFKSYEAFITKAEKAKSGNDTMAMLSLATQSADLSSKVMNLQNNTAWTAADAAKYASLSVKAAAALR